jgi:hypothetical protein
MIAAIDAKPAANRRRARRAGPRSQHGVALIMVLWLTVMMTVIGASFAYAMRNEALAARNTASWAQALAGRWRGVPDRVRAAASQGKSDVWAPNGTVHTWDADDAHRGERGTVW